MPVTLGPALRAHLPLPDVLERGRVNVLRCPMYEDATLSAPSSSTVTVYDSGGTAQVSAAAATITGSVPTYSWTPATTLPLGDRWVVEWAHTYATHGVVVVRNDAMLARVRLTCPVPVGALYQIEPALNPDGTKPITGQSADDHDQVVGDAWDEVQRWLLAQGRRPYLVLGAHVLFDALRCLALARIYRSLAHRGTEAYTQAADRYLAAYQQALQAVVLTYDEQDDALIDEVRPSARNPTVWLGSGSAGRRAWR